MPASLTAALASALVLATGPVPLPAGEMTTIVVPDPAGPELGAPVERVVPSRAFARGAALDGERRFDEAAALYEQAAAEWSASARARPSPALELAVQKANRERQRSLMLASLVPRRGASGAVVTSMSSLDEGNLLREKVVLVRAATGHVPGPLYARARAAYDAALRLPPARRGASDAELRLLLCATHAAAGARQAARLARAHLKSSERRGPDNALPLAICAAALGEDDLALGWLETLVLRPAPHALEPYRLRELYLSNDWDRLRGRPLFESLFPAASP